MKELFNFPQKKGKNLICHPVNKIQVELNEVKISSFKQLKDNNGYFIDCNISANNNQNSIATIKETDETAKQALIDNYNEWFENDEENSEEIIDNLYNNSYIEDIPITLILSNKIETDIIINDEEKEHYELVEYLNANKKNKNCIINIDIIFLGIYINKTSIINKWAIKYINIETLKESYCNDWNRDEIEEEWEYDLIDYENEVKITIEKLQKKLALLKEVFKEVKNDRNMKNWEKNLNKLKSLLFNS
jgi:hypothetical protein